MYRIYNVEKGLFKLKWNWTKTGRIWATRSGVTQHMRNRNYDVQDTNIQVWQYADDGTLTKHETIQTFLDQKPEKKRTPFNVYFVDGKMRSYLYRDQVAETVSGLDTFDDLLVLDKMEYCASGTSALLTGMNTGRKYIALPAAFMKMIPLMCAGTIMGTFGYVNRGRYTKGIELVKHFRGDVKTNDDLSDSGLVF